MEVFRLSCGKTLTRVLQLIAIGLAVASGSQLAYADAPGDRAGFDHAALNSCAALSNLIRTRGAPLSVGCPNLASTQILLSEFFPEGTAILFYQHDGAYLNSWIVAKTGLAAAGRVGVTADEISLRILQYRQALGVEGYARRRAPRPRAALLSEEAADHGSPARSDPAFLSQKQASLSELLFPGPVAEALFGVRSLIVVPCLGIGTVPFAALTVPRDSLPLVERMAVSIAPSLADIGDLRESSRWSRGVAHALVVGDPRLPNSPSWVFPPLPGAAREARDVARILGAEAIIGAQATKKEVLTRAPAADVLYLATHGVASSDDPLDDSFLALGASLDPEGHWTAREIQHSSLQARLVVLSACQTGLGRVHDGGMIGLARAFYLAGVPRTVMSLWSVDDEATAELMTEFAARISQESPEIAMRSAMLTVRRCRPDPAQWASFAVFGSPAIEIAAFDRSEHDSFALELRVRNTASGDLVTDGETVAGGSSYDLVATVRQAREEPGAGRSPLYVIALSTDPQNRSVFLSSRATRIPSLTSFPTIRLARFTVGDPYGVDTLSVFAFRFPSLEPPTVSEPLLLPLGRLIALILPTDSDAGAAPIWVRRIQTRSAPLRLPR